MRWCASFWIPIVQPALARDTVDFPSTGCMCGAPGRDSSSNAIHGPFSSPPVQRPCIRLYGRDGKRLFAIGGASLGELLALRRELASAEPHSRKMPEPADAWAIVPHERRSEPLSGTDSRFHGGFGWLVGSAVATSPAVQELILAVSSLRSRRWPCPRSLQAPEGVNVPDAILVGRFWVIAEVSPTKCRERYLQ